MPNLFKPCNFTLQPSPRWGAPAQGTPCPQVHATLWVDEVALRVRWEVHDTLATFRGEVKEDGGAVWQDSCVELFLECQDGSGDYCNFEFNSRGVCLAARGPDRHHRTPRTESQYAQIQRELIPMETQTESRLCWVLEVRIPRSLLGCAGNLRERVLRGNIYKCGDKTRAPHYLSAFAIETDKPDFHRPEFFGVLYQPTVQ